MTCATAIAALPACKVMVGISALAFGGALIVYALAFVAYRRARLRRDAADRASFGWDAEPSPPRYMRAYFGNWRQ